MMKNATAGSDCKAETFKTAVASDREVVRPGSRDEEGGVAGCPRPFRVRVFFLKCFGVIRLNRL